MKKILISTVDMKMGGIEKALISMINEIDKLKYEVTLVVASKSGILEKDLPKDIKYISMYGDKKSIKDKAIFYLKKGEFVKLSKFLWNSLLYRFSKKPYKIDGYYLNMLEDIDGVYDLAIAYHGQMSIPLRYIMDKVKATKKVMWIHSDPTEYKSYMKNYEHYYSDIDKIFVVSKEAKCKFINIYPNIKDKVEIFYNIISKNKINELANLGVGFEDNFDGTRILTIGRLTDEKGQDMIPSIVSKLTKNGYKIRWYCIGEGEYRSVVENKIKEFDVEDGVILLGNKSNPYKYLKECDIYVQPSRHECYCTTVTEAKCLEKIIIATDVNGTKEQINHKQNGIIVKFDEELLYEEIKKTLENSEFSYRIYNNLKNESVDTRLEIKKLYDILE